MPYDGLTYTYRVVAANQPGNRSPAERGHVDRGRRPPGAVGLLQRGGHGHQPGGPAPVHRPGLPRHDEQGRDPGRRPGQPDLQPADRHRSRPGSRCRATSSPIRSSSGCATRRRPPGCTLSGQQNVQSYGRLDGMLNDIGAADGQRQGRHLDGHRHRATATPAQLVYRSTAGPADDRPLRRRRVQPVHHRSTAATTTRTSGSRCALRDNAPGGRGESYESDTTPGAARPTRASACAGPEPGGDCNDGDDAREQQLQAATATTTCPCATPTLCARIEFTVNGLLRGLRLPRVQPPGSTTAPGPSSRRIDARRDGDVHAGTTGTARRQATVDLHGHRRLRQDVSPASAHGEPAPRP